MIRDLLSRTYVGNTYILYNTYLFLANTIPYVVTNKVPNISYHIVILTSLWYRTARTGQTSQFNYRHNNSHNIQKASLRRK